MATLEVKALYRVTLVTLCSLFIYLFKYVLAFIDKTAEDMTGNRMRERGSEEPQARTPAQGWGQNLCTWDSCSTNWAKRGSSLPIINDDNFCNLSGHRCNSSESPNLRPVALAWSITATMVTWPIVKNLLERPSGLNPEKKCAECHYDYMFIQTNHKKKNHV